MANKRTLKQLGQRESFNPAPVGSKDSWKDQLHAEKKNLSILKKRNKK